MRNLIATKALQTPPAVLCTNATRCPLHGQAASSDAGKAPPSRTPGHTGQSPTLTRDPRPQEVSAAVGTLPSDEGTEEEDKEMGSWPQRGAGEWWTCLGSAAQRLR